MKDKIIDEVLEYVKLILVVVVITTLLNTLLFTFSTVKQSSMEHTLNENDVLIIEKMSYNFNEPKQGDIIVFVEEEAVAENFLTKLSVLYQDMFKKLTGQVPRPRLVKRVIGLPGDVINIEDGHVYVNDVKLDEDYVDDLTFAKILDYPHTVPAEHYFVLGDNRDVSKDSRHFGDVPMNNIEGKAVFRLSPFSVFGLVK